VARARKDKGERRGKQKKNGLCTRQAVEGPQQHTRAQAQQGGAKAGGDEGTGTQTDARETQGGAGVKTSKQGDEGDEAKGAVQKLANGTTGARLLKRLGQPLTNAVRPFKDHNKGAGGMTTGENRAGGARTDCHCGTARCQRKKRETHKTRLAFSGARRGP